MRALPTLCKILALGALSLFAADAVQAQGYTFELYGPDQGLDNLSLRTILQDQTGFLWVGTSNGLFRYDGRRFKAYGPDKGLPSGSIDCLYESPDGILW